VGSGTGLEICAETFPETAKMNADRITITFFMTLFFIVCLFFNDDTKKVWFLPLRNVHLTKRHFELTAKCFHDKCDLEEHYCHIILDKKLLANRGNPISRFAFRASSDSFLFVDSCGCLIP
jgi:hypothetical protein